MSVSCCTILTNNAPSAEENSTLSLLRESYFLNGDDRATVQHSLLRCIPKFYEVVSELVCEYWKPVLQIPCTLDVCDERGEWIAATALHQSGDYVAIHYNGFTCKYDDWIHMNSFRLAPYWTYTGFPANCFQYGFEALLYPLLDGKSYCTSGELLPLLVQRCIEFVKTGVVMPSMRHWRLVLPAVVSKCVQQMQSKMQVKDNNKATYNTSGSGLLAELSDALKVAWNEELLEHTESTRLSIQQHPRLNQFLSNPRRFRLEANGRIYEKRKLNQSAKTSVQEFRKKT
jgi:hypothetical protein